MASNCCEKPVVAGVEHAQVALSVPKPASTLSANTLKKRSTYFTHRVFAEAKRSNPPTPRTPSTTRVYS
ncbi:hypothetical protein B9Q03_09100 [Candidatus Marsarchaeota G2 archaeon OSP_D]|uniref:Uncharacterized protein n=2 Tax=Candidatus Marsarchaeota group 2 TaxID=2203771 RepID=A0A2R6B9Y4_9ARCH|nr:MAG: hypothetical protein B9Q03_09100 [Candidatus Marsarchaeota G2 archaeon OSP_D]PSN95421.1 MAG: hypothetical protein B9Q06_05950 [Candidatus Marsarchaeota G2 archaeon ECH_B_2]